ncbi:condensation domain-containing protein, partial [Pyxidicoccus sp. 3LFB2]
SPRWTDGPQVVFHAVPSRVLELEEAGDAARLEQRLREEASRPFDLEHGPLYRFRLLSASPHRQVLVLVFHHLVTDGASINVLMRELGVLHTALARSEAPALAPLPLEYADVAAWQHTPAASAREPELLAYWKRQLDGAPRGLELPTDLPRPALRSDRGALTERLALSPTLVGALRAFCREHQVTPFMVLYAAFSALLYRYSRQDDFCVGTPVSGRTHPSTEGVVGLFVNTVVLRSRVAPGDAFTALLAQARSTTLEALAHQDLPFERLVQALGVERDAGQTPLFQVMFDLYRVEHSLAGAFAGTDARDVPLDTGACEFDLHLTLFESESGFDLFARYSTDLFEGPTVRRLLGHYLHLLSHALRAPRTRVDSLALLPDAERAGVLGGLQPARRPFPLDVPFHEHFSDQAARTPEAVALAAAGGVRWTYATLEAWTNRAARRLV